MEFKRVVISCLLVFTYTLGFAHNLIPHCELDDTEHQVANHESHSHHHHQHHQHAPNDDVDHEHIVHNGHLDGGLYDYIVCFLTDAQHPTKGCNLQHYIHAKTQGKVDTKIAKTSLVATLFAICFNMVLDEPLPNISSAHAVTYPSPPIEQSPHRGPPSLSC